MIKNMLKEERMKGDMPFSPEKTQEYMDNHPTKLDSLYNSPMQLLQHEMTEQSTRLDYMQNISTQSIIKHINEKFKSDPNVLTNFCKYSKST